MLNGMLAGLEALLERRDLSALTQIMATPGMQGHPPVDTDALPQIGFSCPLVPRGTPNAPQPSMFLGPDDHAKLHSMALPQMVLGFSSRASVHHRPVYVERSEMRMSFSLVQNF